MSQKELNQVNKVYHAIVLVVSVALAITAIIYNPAHLVTAGIIFAAGMESDFKCNEDDKLNLRY